MVGCYLLWCLFGFKMLILKKKHFSTLRSDLVKDILSDEKGSDKDQLQGLDPSKERIPKVYSRRRQDSEGIFCHGDFVTWLSQLKDIIMREGSEWGRKALICRTEGSISEGPLAPVGELYSLVANDKIIFSAHFSVISWITIVFYLSSPWYLSLSQFPISFSSLYNLGSLYLKKLR